MMKLPKISRTMFLRHYGATALSVYTPFCSYVDEKIAEVIDSETSVTGLKVATSWKDAGGNRHARLSAQGHKRDKQDEIGAVIVWLVRSRKFRGGFWSKIRKQTDAEYYAEAREAFYRKDYRECLRLAEFITVKYSGSSAFRKMLRIAERYDKPAGRDATG